MLVFFIFNGSLHSMFETYWNAPSQIRLRHLIKLVCCTFLSFLYSFLQILSFKDFFSNFILDEDVYKPYPCLCASNDVYNLRAERCFNDPAIDCEPCSRSVCGSWSRWSSWSGCSRTCGGGERSRDRTFTWYDDRTFVEVETEDCNTGRLFSKRRLKIYNLNYSETCPHWGRWKSWGPCSQPCYVDGQPKPVQDRYRCWTINGVEDCGTGSGHEYYDYAERPCNTDNECAAVCEWSDWGQWSACNPDCKQGIRLQRRTNNEDSEGTGWISINLWSLISRYLRCITIQPLKGAACTGQSVRSENCGDIAVNECEDCFDKYDKCDRIPTNFCTDVRYASKMKRKQFKTI